VELRAGAVGRELVEHAARKDFLQGSETRQDGRWGTRE
jgi:hypothetical protein